MMQKRVTSVCVFHDTVPAGTSDPSDFLSKLARERADSVQGWQFYVKEMATGDMIMVNELAHTSFEQFASIKAESQEHSAKLAECKQKIDAQGERLEEQEKRMEAMHPL